MNENIVTEMPSQSYLEPDFTNDILNPMTICIAALSDSGKKVIAGTDSMMTYTIGNNVTYQIENKADKKLRYVNKNVVVMGAGITDSIEVVFTELMGKVLEADTPKQVMEKLREIYVSFTRTEQERKILIPVGLNWESYIKKQKVLINQL